jgi:hypothetical protein
MKLIGENRSTRGATCPSATLSTTNPTRTDPGSNLGLRDERPATNRLSHGTAPGTHLPLLVIFTFYPLKYVLCSRNRSVVLSLCNSQLHRDHYVIHNYMMASHTNFTYTIFLLKYIVTNHTHAMFYHYVPHN